MNTRRLNITIPKKDYERLSQKPNKSAFISEAIRAKFDAEEKESRERRLAEAYRRSAVEDRELKAEWDTTSGDGL